jgi:hypothetical protein
MLNREQITRLTIAWVVEEKFAPKMDNQNCRILCNYISKKSVFNNKANVLMSIVIKDILGFIDSNINKEYAAINRTFNLLCAHCHLTMISQNFSECKQYL